MSLQTFFQEHPQGALALSGGVDSALLAWAAAKYGCGWQAYYVRTPFQPAFELVDAREVAAICDLPIEIIDLDVLSNKAVAENPPDRCYFCKQAIFSAVLNRAQADGYTLVIDGTNASDDASDRPGMRALQELEIWSPLRECGLTKEEVRRLSREAGLPTWDKPAYACLATRVPTGTRLTEDLLQNIEDAEEVLKELGFRDFRVRLRDGGAMVQVTAVQRPLAEALWKKIAEQLSALFGSAKLDETDRVASV